MSQDRKFKVFLVSTGTRFMGDFIDFGSFRLDQVFMDFGLFTWITRVFFKPKLGNEKTFPRKKNRAQREIRKKQKNGTEERNIKFIQLEQTFNFWFLERTNRVRERKKDINDN